MGDSFDDVVYTAFGQPVCAIAGGSCTGVANPRYGYAGAWGYQSNDEFPFLHVGARYYDPATGRFLQRDPIGITGGLNVYAYVRNGPTIRIDPDGLRYRPPGATGPPEKGFTDGFWSKVHYSAGWAAGKAGMGFGKTLCLAIRWERWEPGHWPGWNESLLNRIGDVVVAGIGWIDAHL
jgi:RHS repeat-associated protein